jgi:hypothetical protein
VYKKYKNLPCPCSYSLQYSAAHVCAHLRVAPACGPVTVFAPMPTPDLQKLRREPCVCNIAPVALAGFFRSSRGSIRRRFAMPAKKMAMKNCHFICCRWPQSPHATKKYRRHIPKIWRHMPKIQHIRKLNYAVVKISRYLLKEKYVLLSEMTEQQG